MMHLTKKKAYQYYLSTGGGMYKYMSGLVELLQHTPYHSKRVKSHCIALESHSIVLESNIIAYNFVDSLRHIIPKLTIA